MKFPYLTCVRLIFWRKLAATHVINKLLLQDLAQDTLRNVKPRDSEAKTKQSVTYPKLIEKFNVQN